MSLHQLIKYPAVLARHEAAPFLEERESYLAHRAQEGCADGTLLRIARELHCIVQQLDVPPEGVGVGEVASAADRWASSQRDSGRARELKWSRLLFVQVAVDWLRFLGRLREPVEDPKPYAWFIEDFAIFMRSERGLSKATIRDHVWHATKLLDWMFARGNTLSDAQVQDVDAFLAMRSSMGWCRVSIASCVKALKAFFRHAEMRGWCPDPIALAIEGPRLFAHEPLPQGPEWEQVQLLLAHLDTDRPRDIRNRAIALLFAVYGLRSSDVTNLRIDSIDWERDRVSIWRQKQRVFQTYPLDAAVGNAVVRYLVEVRPKCPSRHLFVTLRAPFRPLSQGAIYSFISAGLTKIGVTSPHRGPHSLRHACATRLVTEGLSFKEIGDHLGHRSSFATRIYAKMDLPRLRQVAAVDLGGVL